MPGPSDTIQQSDVHEAIQQSDVQQEVSARCLCYRERLVRHLYLKNETFEFEHGWTDANGYPTEKKMWHVVPPADDASAAEKAAWNALPADQLFLYRSVMSTEGNQDPIYTACD